MTSLAAVPTVAARLTILSHPSSTVPVLRVWGHRRIRHRRGTVTVAELIHQFDAHQHVLGFAPKTLARRRGTLRLFAEHLAPRHYNDATVADVEAFLGLYNKPRTRHAYRSDLRVFYAWAVKMGLLDTDPAAKIDRIRVPDALPRPIRAPLETALTTGHRRTRLMTALGYYAGLRCCEIAALDAEDVWLDRSPPLLVVRDGKGGKDRRVFVHPELAAMLADAPQTGPLFTSKRNGHVRASSVSQTLARHLARCGVDATAHRLRHTFGTELAASSGGDVVFTGAQMGHSETKTTLGYIGLAGDHGADAVARMYRRSSGGDSAA